MSQAKNPNHHRVDYLEFPAASTAPLKQFYSSVFAWKFEDYGPDYTSFQDGRLAGGFDAHASWKASGPSALVVMYSENLEATELAVREAGGTITRPIFPFPGGRRFHFTDPGGNELAVWSDVA